ncbi:type I-E CRISPR-associated protein Cas7/Cse4/CasC [Sulfobacillus thermosulfidooxidans]|uniref:type I-E CRISPR-associated protein Cas7/Cse4/CasC n=1 Tax=Sulfobacillus thermosulfidooxidans TaxID=28034 RepID=UPI000366FA86|nr:type I-E CRISPR-associated protein Cas7/Cse4/CasC [Sulfobacillus thermosulfidooxidans]
MFIQVHFLTSYHASLLNRDDAGLAKRITFGGVPRLRISSQSQKRHWREWLMDRTDFPSGWRTRHFFDRVILPRVMEQGVSEDLAKELTGLLATQVLHAAGNNAPVDPEKLETKQPILFGKPEADYFVSMIMKAVRSGSDAKVELNKDLKNQKSNLQAMLGQLTPPSVGFEGALFGRFVTSDVLARVDAPVHVAHAFTTHALDSEVDYFTVLDDLAREEETGAAHANDQELSTGVFYGYVVVDIPGLISNLTACPRDQWKAQDLTGPLNLLKLFLEAVAKVSPGAKLGSTAPYARAQCVVLEAGSEQPRTLANAFLKPVRSNNLRSDLMTASVEAMANHITQLESMYDTKDTTRWVSTIHQWPRDHERPIKFPEAIRSVCDFIERSTVQ